MEPVDAIEPFPELPFELVCLIIEKLLEIEPQRAPALACLSRDIQPMVERALYRCVVLRNRRRAPGLFVDMIKSSCRPDTFYRDNVKMLCTTDYMSIPDLHLISSACSGVQQLAICNWAWDGAVRATSPPLHACIDALLSSGPRPSKLACHYSLTDRPDGSHRFTLPLFEKVTHLQLGFTTWLNDFNGRQLHSMKGLTHLALIEYSNPAISLPKNPPQTLYLADSIIVCIIYAEWFHELERDAAETIRKEYNDPRVVIAPSQSLEDESIYNLLRPGFPNNESFIRQWGHRCDGEEMDMWKEAEAIVKAQKALLREELEDLFVALWTIFGYFELLLYRAALELIIAGVTLPTAKTISISSIRVGYVGDSSAESRFFGFYGATLETLWLQGVCFDDDLLLVILRSLPNLKNLIFQPIPSNKALTPPCLTGDVYRQIMAGSICPALETLDVSVAPNVMEAFMDLLDSRGPGLFTAAVHLTGYRPSAIRIDFTSMVRIEPNLVSSFGLRVALLKGAGLAIKANHARSER
ncbi:hypothetical protein C8J56DRAFT_1025718 [Mycena floridula]|nr:hypothetical protein C8J56DRAFT_1025718 [Mycena floridula]